MRKDPQGNPLPPRFHWKHGRYWYVRRNKWEPLSSNYAEAMGRYARLTAPGSGMDALVDKVIVLLEQRKQDPLSANTLTQYRYAAKLIKEAFAEFSPAEVRQTDVAIFHDDMCTRHVNMANRCLTVLRIVFTYGTRWGLVSHNPVVGLKRHKEHKRGRYLTDNEFAAIRAQARPWLALLMDVLYLTAQRVGDVLGVRRLDLTTDGVEFRQQKGDKPLRVEWTHDLRATLTAAEKLHGNVLSKFVFHPRGKGTAYSYFSARDAFRLACKAAGVEDATLHDIRAKSLTDADAEGKDATALAGHANKSMTERYLRLRRMKTVSGPGFLRQSIDKSA